MLEICFKKHNWKENVRYRLSSCTHMHKPEFWAKANVQPDWILYIIHHRAERWNTMRKRVRAHLRTILPCYAAPVYSSIITWYLSGHLMLPQHSTSIKPAIIQTTSISQQSLHGLKETLHTGVMYGYSKCKTQQRLSANRMRLLRFQMTKLSSFSSNWQNN